MSRYFCHTCNSRIERINADYTCPSCSEGFIEELDESQQQQQQQQPDADHQHGPNPIDFFQLIGLGSSHGGFPMRFHRAHPSSSSASSTEDGGTTPTTTASASNTSTTGATGSSPSPNVFTANSGRTRGSGPHFSFIFDGRTGTATAAGGGGAAGGGSSEIPVENMFLTFITDLITGLGGGQQQMGGLGFPLSGNINLGDYAWGREGFDAIVTQLMNNMEGTGPPPMSTDKLSELNNIQISKEQVEAKLQCSVCWEDFTFGENVIRLECEHIYHSDCILPWLKLHGTCPVCRKDFTSSTSTSESTPQQPATNNANSPNTTTALDEDMEFD